MILVQVVAPVREDQVGFAAGPYLFHAILHVGPLVGEVAFAELQDVDVGLPSGAEPRRRAATRFALPGPGCAQHMPVDLEFRPGLEQPEQGPPTSDLDVVGVGAKKQDRTRAPSFKAGYQHGQ